MEASINGRRLTLDPITFVAPISLPRRRVESSLPCGLRVSWMAGDFRFEGSSYTFDLTCGAGVGSPWLILSVRSTDGESVEEIVDMGEVTKTWLEAIVARDEERQAELPADDVCNACGVYVKGGNDPAVMSQHDCEGEEQ